jgi:hypothetical protein
MGVCGEVLQEVFLPFFIRANVDGGEKEDKWKNYFGINFESFRDFF